MTPELAVVVFGLTSALSWGAGDFSGGLASKRTNEYAVVLLSQAVGGILILVIALSSPAPFPQIGDLAIGGLAGFTGVLGILFFYRALAAGRMGVVAPIAALVSTAIPMLAGILLEGFPDPRPAFGFLLAILSVFLLSRAAANTGFHLKEFRLPFLAGLGFASFFILIDQVSETAIYWPLVAARISSITTMLLITRLKRKPIQAAPDQLPIIALAGVFDIGGNIFFALASRYGRLDIAATLSSLYTGVTVLLAYLILKERLTRSQQLGVLTTLLAVFLISS